MIDRKLIGMKKNYGKNLMSLQIKPSKYLDMVVSAIQFLKDGKGSSPKNIVAYITRTYNIVTDQKSISSRVSRALKKGLDDDLLLKNSNGNYSLIVECPCKNRFRERWLKKHGRKKKGKKKRKKKKKTKRKKKKKKAKKKRKKRSKRRKKK